VAPTRARIALLLLAAVGLALIVVEPALGAAGGGSSGFSGGGGGGGGGGSFSGGGSSGSGSGSGGGFITFVIIILVFLLIFGAQAVQAVKYRRKRAQRVKRVRLAAAEAAEDDTAFGADMVQQWASWLFMECQTAWDGRDRKRLAELIDADLLVEWTRRLDDFDQKGWHNRVSPLEPPEVEYMGLVNRAEDEEDRVVVWIEARLHDYVVDANGHKVMKTGESTSVTTLKEYWTLAKRGDAWIVASIEQKAEGDHHLDDSIVTTPWADERVRDEALVEQAVSDKLPEGFKPADVADLDFDGDARAAALDLSVADPRFAPDILEAAARRAVEAWANAVDGSDAPLEAVASPEAVTELLYPGDTSRTTRLVVRGPRVKQIRVAALDASTDPATMTIEVDLGGRRYVENRDTAAVVSGSRDSASTFTERWRLALGGPDSAPWRLVDAHAAAKAA
jgi:predicted lipid-binding transport protein (Tim44 family)